ncbi:MAG: 30S ribosomal protein S6 [Alphaproteobacteria bacterium]
MALYESVFITRQDISSSQAEALVDSFAEIIANSGGSVPKKEYWGLRNLAYRIKKNRKGHYALLNIDAPPAAITEMERNMRLNEDVLRFMTVRVDELDDGPSPVLRSRDERGGRGGRGRRDDGDRPRRDAAPDKEQAADPPDEGGNDEAPQEGEPT